MPRRKRPFIETPFTKKLGTRVLRYVRRNRVLNTGERVLVAVSGGQDSTALLLLLARLTQELDLGEATVAHFDHGLRSGQEARDDEAAVRELARALGLRFVAGSGDVRRRARRRRQSIEEAARHLRYAFLKREAKRLEAHVVLVGHTRGDRAETVLLHLLRGSGLDGLVGLRARSAWPFGRGPALARPLLEVTREETLRYCREAGVTPREDPTNLLLEATRNRLRHEVLPALRRLNPRIEEALCRLGESVTGSVDYLESAAGGGWRSLASVEETCVVFPRQAFEALAPPLRARLLRRAVRRLAVRDAELEATHIAAVEEALGKRRGRTSLPGGLTASVTARDVRVMLGREEPARRIEETELTVPGRTMLPGWTVTAEIAKPPGEPRPSTRLEAWLNADAMGPRIVVRSRLPGDRLRPLGLGGERKVQDVLVDAKVPREERDSLPVVCASWGVAWVVGQRLDERAAVREGTLRALRLRFRRRAEKS